jgi:arylsulfatase A-like enzyme
LRRINFTLLTIKASKKISQPNEAIVERRNFLKTISAAGAGFYAAGAFPLNSLSKLIGGTSFNRNNERPNVLLFLADDLGYGDVSCYGGINLVTKNIDRIAANGIRFTNGYATAATCTPSRYSLLTGFYPWRTKGAHVLPGDAPLLISDSTETLPAIFKKAGYQTGVVGKWHLGLGNGTVDWNKKIEPGPNNVGFDYSFIMAATNDRVPTVYCENGNVVNLKSEDPLLVNYRKNFPGEPTGKENPEMLKLYPSQGHDMSIVNGISRIGFQKGGKDAMWTDEDMSFRFLEKAKNFINGNSSSPFFLYYALQQPHVPRTPNKMFAGKSGLGARGDSILEADWCVGQILDYLEEKKLMDNTIVIFTSDNGPVLDDGYKDEAVKLNGMHKPAGDLRGGKYSLYDGGTHVPFIVSWKNRIAPGVSDAIVCQMDLKASFSQMLSVNNSESDSENIIDSLLGKTDAGRDEIVLEGSGEKVAFRKGDWVLIPPYKGPALDVDVNIELGNSPEYQLYNIKEDPSQKTNLYSSDKCKAEELSTDLNRIRKRSFPQL